ncbi:uncharacterized protein LOC127928208 isoform X2 [Oncorhynchus keta]|uniref:uncharacterized protein LOC127928208 isoform X2 n=1 Tax=Oncorhynchus keta TaxID=8018 RepID=UPI00227D6ACC|nr:uncharacterized protein LOC127928208 isoform X2 [Oncorhynchus keta]
MRSPYKFNNEKAWKEERLPETIPFYVWINRRSRGPCAVQPKQYRVPASQMREKACECQGMFATGLKHVVNKVKARTEEHKPLLNRLQKNIQALPQKSTPKEASICPMKSKSLLTRPPNTVVLMAYIYFLKNLNEKEC